MTPQKYLIRTQIICEKAHLANQRYLNPEIRWFLAFAIFMLFRIFTGFHDKEHDYDEDEDDDVHRLMLDHTVDAKNGDTLPRTEVEVSGRKRHLVSMLPKNLVFVLPPKFGVHAAQKSVAPRK